MFTQKYLAFRYKGELFVWHHMVIGRENVIPVSETRLVGADWVFPYLVAIKTRNP